MTKRPETVDAFLAALPEDKRAALEKLRRDVLAAAPKAVECISYGMPAFRHEGRVLAWFGAAKNHCAFYPGAWPIEACKADLVGYDTSKGTIRFAPGKPLPSRLVQKLVKARLAEQAGR